ncbi:hypothetical protein O181_003050 [Austropuccinia psidii MF-1]|uniref:Uncharacterized protein n=1 Tax=Austropuccinia psidii MF-1 TaxID=1389203 RepID=A0A9Q3BE71_9BASI|nr:hypothetical protein [Austropuccinia psidii MF-1]
MKNRRSSQYSIQLDGGGLRSRNDPTKGKRKDKIPSGTEYTQGSAISQSKVPEMPIISEPELELSMRNYKRDKLNSEGSYRYINEPVQTVLHGVQGQRVGKIATNPPRSGELPEPPEKVHQRGGNSDILQWMEITSIRTPNIKHKGMEQQKEGGKKGRSPSSFYQKATSQKPHQGGKKNKKKNLRKENSPGYTIPRIQKDAMENVFNMA